MLALTRKTVRHLKPRRYRPRFTRTSIDGVLNGVVAYNQYGGYCVPLSSLHRSAAQRTLAGKVWEPETVKFLIDNCGAGDVIHAGTYFGDFLPALSHACKGTVWAFEPSAENYRCARITTVINDLQNVELTNAALGEKDGTVGLVTSDKYGRPLGGGSYVIEGGHRTTKAVTIDGVIPPDRQVSLIQLDVEGFEANALEGGARTIKRWRPILVLETPPGAAWIAQWLPAYQFDRHINKNTVLRVR